VELISRKAAKAAGLKYYFTGQPCKRGHIDVRFVCSFACKTCGREKALEAFRNLEGERREARREYERQRWSDPEYRQKRLKYREQSAEYRRRRKLKNPDEFRDHYAKNKERRKRASSEWYHANVDRALQNRREYVAKNRDKARVWGRKSANKRRAITKDVFIEAVDPRVVFAKANGVCGICGEAVEMKSRWEVDHIIPISKGGTHCYANVQLSHRKCNRSKAARLPQGQPTLFQVKAS